MGTHPHKTIQPVESQWTPLHNFSRQLVWQLTQNKSQYINSTLNQRIPTIVQASPSSTWLWVTNWPCYRSGTVRFPPQAGPGISRVRSLSGSLMSRFVAGWIRLLMWSLSLTAAAGLRRNAAAETTEICFLGTWWLLHQKMIISSADVIFLFFFIYF